MNKQIKGYILAAVSASTYGMNPLFAIPLYNDGMDANSVLLFRYLFAIPALLIMGKARGRSFTLRRYQWLPVMALGLLVALSSLALFQSYNFMNSGIASTLLFVYPIMVAVIMALVFREQVPPYTWFCIAIAAFGIALLCKSSGDNHVGFTGICLVMLSALSYAIYMVSVNRRNLCDIATLPLTFYILAFGLILFIISAIVGEGIKTPTHSAYWGNLVGLAIFPTAVSFLCATLAIQYIGSTPTAILGALEPVTAILFSVTLLDQPVSSRDIVGMVLIIIAVTLVIAGGKIAAPLTRIKRLFPRLRR